MTFLPIRLKHLLALKNKSKKTSPVSHSAENLHELDRYNNSKPLSFKIQITEFRSTICDLRQKSECQIDHRNDQKSIKNIKKEFLPEYSLRKSSFWSNRTRLLDNLKHTGKYLT
jgi:hypothetical protein